MYIPKFFAETDEESLLAFMREFNFAALITSENDVPTATHIPFIIEKRADNIVLSAHLAKANLHWKQFAEKQILVIFQEPHAYISPSLYVERLNVPTWNYVAVHAYGKAKIFQTVEENLGLLEKMIKTFDMNYFENQWHEIPDEYKIRQANAIIAFEIEVTDLQGLRTLLQHFVQPCRSLIEVMAPTSSLARRLLASPQPSILIRWRITALGAFSCHREERGCDFSAAHQAVLLRLLDAGPGGLPVERLWEDVWGNSSISMPALHQALYRLRNATGLAVTVRDGVCIIQSPWDEIDYDVHILEQILTSPLLRESVEQAVALYRGDFFPSAPLSASLWADARRAYLQQRYLDFLEQYAHMIEHDEPHVALRYYQQILQINNYREPTAASLMRLAGQFGNRALVNATYEQLKSALRSLGAVPDTATTDLHQQLQAHIKGSRHVRTTSPHS